MRMRDRLLAEDRDDRIADRRVKPALLALIHDQAELIDSTTGGGDGGDDLRRGFGDRRSLIEWYQRASVRTLGHIASGWPPGDCFSETEVLLPALIRGDKQYAPEVDAAGATKYRQLLESSVVQPAFNRAYSDLRRHAREYVEGDSDDYDSGPTDSDLRPGKQKSVAMRPGFQTLDKQQHEALAELWGGFESRDGVLDWVHALNSPSAGKVDDDLAEQIITDDVAMEYLVWGRDGPGARAYREMVAASVVLPYFVAAVEDMDTNELAESSTDIPTTHRMKGSNR